VRVAFIQQPWESGFPPKSSVGIWTYRVVKRLVAKGVKVRVYAGVGQRPAETLEGIEYLETPAPLDPYRHALFGRWGGKRPRQPFIGSSQYHRGYAEAIGRDLAGWKPDIIHLHNFSQFVPLLRHKNPSTKIVLHMHCEWLSQLDPAWIGPRIAHADAVVGCSEHVSGLVRSAFPQFAPKVHTVYNGTEMGGTPARTKPTLLYVGRISPEKGVHVLLEAFEQVLNALPEASLKLVGLEQVPPPEYLIDLSDEAKVKALRRFYPGSYLEQLKAQMSPAATQRAEFLGFVPYAGLPELYGQARVLVNPALSEAFGMSLAEAMASGVAVVASKTGGMSEIVQEGQTGLLVEAGNARALAEALVKLLQDPNLAQQMGLKGRVRAGQLFAWDTIAAHTWALYQGLMG
jgi:glycosyltransferase involved in cell wall biosynthesis